MTPTILTLNAGSSSVKFQVFEQDTTLPRLAEGSVSGIGTRPVLTASRDGDTERTTISLPAQSVSEDAVHAIIKWVHDHDAGWQITVIAHRIVHGGSEFITPVQVTADVLRKLKLLIPLAPLHQPHNLAGLGIAARALPHTPQIACFDTAFHAQHEALFSRFALPQEMHDQGVRRYGFHGLSYAWIAHVLKRDFPLLSKGRVIVAHLGNGASLCALKNGKSVDTTMSMTTLDGVPMGTRSGAIDAGAVIYMIREQKMGTDKVEHLLYEQSGLKGLSGLSNDVKTLLASTDPRAKFALDYFALYVAKFAASMVVSLGGIDGFVFTGGIGEHAADVRNNIMKHLSFLNTPQILVIPADEERIMAMQAIECLKG